MKKSETKTKRMLKERAGGAEPGEKELASDAVYRAIKQMVFLNRFKAGGRINVERLTRELGVSRTPVWEAIRRLQQEGILTKVPNRGVLMRESPLERVYELLQTLEPIESFAIRLAAEKVTSTTLDKLSECLHDQMRGIETRDLALYGTAEMRFHRLIYEASGNSFLLELFDFIASRMLPSRLNHLPVLPTLYLIHREIVEGLGRGDADRAQKAWVRHNEIMLTLLKEQIHSQASVQEMVSTIKRDFPLPKRHRTIR